MKLNFKSLPELLTYYQDEELCKKLLAQQRWNGKPICPHCKYDKKIYVTNRGYKCGNPECHKKFTVLVGSVFEHLRIPLSKAYAALYLATAHKKGISSLQLSRDLGITQKNAWHLMHRIREILKDKNSTLLSGTVEGDESFFGGKNKNRHSNKKVKESQGRSHKDKTPVFGLLQRDGKLKVQVVADTKAKTLKPIIKDLVEKGAIIVTDEWGAYNGLSKDFTHEVVKHNSGEYVKGNFHTNSIEGFWSLFKRGIFGIYHYASPKHLHRYTDEFSYRFNTRHISDQDRFSNSLKNVEGKLTYKQLIKN